MIICGGTNIKESTSNIILSWLRREARKGIEIGGLCTAAYVIAKAGLLDGRKCTIHWENREAFLEEFPNLDLVNRYSPLIKTDCAQQAVLQLMLPI